MSRGLAALALAVALLAACDEDELYTSCPGEPVATFDLSGAAEPAPPLLPDELPLPACPGEPATVAFTATVAFHPLADGRAALCVGGRSAEPASGTRSGDTIDVQTVTGGAVLETCGELCQVSVTERVVGTLLPGAESPERFEGVLVDTVRAVGPAASCGTCELPCAARYAIRSVD